MEMRNAGFGFIFYSALYKKAKGYITRKNIFACLFSVHNTISLSRHEQVCLMRLRFLQRLLINEALMRLLLMRLLFLTEH